MAKRRTTGFAGRKLDVSSGKSTGRPVIYDASKMAKDLLAWSEKEESINICGFCADYGYTYMLIQGKRKSNEEFKAAYEIVRLRLAERRERLLNTDLLHSHAYNRYQSCYDPFLDKYEDKKKDQDAKRKKEIAQAQVEKLPNLADMLKDLDLGEFTQK